MRNSRRCSLARLSAWPLIALATLPLSAGAQSSKPAAKLVTPPPGAHRCDIMTGSTTYGQSFGWQSEDGVRWSRDTLLDRGYAYDVEQQLRLAPGGALRELRIRGSTPGGEVDERFETKDGRFRFTSPIDRGDGSLAANAFYLPFTQTVDSLFALAEALARAPGRRMNLAPSGEVRLEPLGQTEVTVGGVTKTLTAYALGLGGGGGAQPIWFEGDRVFGLANSLNYGIAGWLNCLPKGWEAVAPQLKEAQEKGAAKRAADLLPRVAPRLEGALAFTNVRLYDAPGRRFVEDMTVVVRDGRIVAAGPAGDARVPAGAQIVRGAGKTLLPGLWDSHIHYGDDEAGVLLLSQGITSVRDNGSFADQIFPRKRRIEQGLLLGPRIIPMKIIDGTGPLSVFLADKVADEAAALEAVRLAKRQGYAGVKFYNSVDPKLVPLMAREAKKLGMRVQGHVPASMRALDAVASGYDEINHGNFILLQALPDAVVAKTDTLERHYGPIRLSDQIDFASPGMQKLFDVLATRQIVVDPTLNVLKHLWTDRNGELSEAYKPFADRLPFHLQRGLKMGGIAPEPGVDRATVLRGFEKLKAIVPILYRRGIPVVAGTDGLGLELVHELELYVSAGLTPAEALATATVIPAKAFGVDGETGSIAVGKLAEMVLVTGNPSERIGDLRNVDLVLTQGRLMKADTLLEAAGLSTQ